jgi:hypothetical protein
LRAYGTLAQQLVSTFSPTACLEENIEQSKEVEKGETDKKRPAQKERKA